MPNSHLSLPAPVRELIRTSIAWSTILRNPKVARATVIQAQKDLEAAIAALPLTLLPSP